MRRQRGRLLLLTLLTTLLALLGIGKGSANAVARNIQCSHKLAHNLELASSLERRRTGPPGKRNWGSAYFVANYPLTN